MKHSLVGTSIIVPTVICFTDNMVGIRKLFKRWFCLSSACVPIFRLLFDVTLFEFKLLSPVFEALFQLLLASIICFLFLSVWTVFMGRTPRARRSADRYSMRQYPNPNSRAPPSRHSPNGYRPEGCLSPLRHGCTGNQGYRCYLSRP